MRRLKSLILIAVLTFWAGPTVEYKGKLLIKPSKKSIERVTRKIGDAIKNGKAWKQENLINSLNPIIIVWSNYHRPVVSSGVFDKLDEIVCNMLWSWAKRRPPDKSRTLGC